MARRRASATWDGNLNDGRGQTTLASGVAGPLDVNWRARTVDGEPNTSPEELIAAAHASCFSMAFANVLAQAGSAPEELRTSATVTFQPGEGITRIALTTAGRVPGMAPDAFRDAAEQAKDNCPVSKALTGVGEITVDAHLDT